MKRLSMAWLVFLAAAVVSVPGSAQDGAPSEGPGWTGTSNPLDVISARQALMLAIESRMLPIDTSTVEDDVDPAVIAESADTIAAMLLAAPHLFPPTTNVYDPDAEEPETLALPAIWESFPTFYTMAMNAADTATRMAATKDADALRTAAVSLRAECDACHALYLRPYEPGEVTQEDLDFDFDSIFDK